MKKWLVGLIPFFVLLLMVVSPVSGTFTTHDNVTYTVWLETDRTSIEVTAPRFDTTDMDWDSSWELESYDDIEKVYIDLYTAEMSYDFYIHNGERYKADIDIVGCINYRPSDQQDFDRLRYYGTTGSINAGDSRAGTLPTGDPLNPDELPGWQIGAQFLLIWYALEHPTADPSDFDYFISAVIVEVMADDFVPTEPPEEDDTTDEDTTDEGTTTDDLPESFLSRLIRLFNEFIANLQEWFSNIF